MVLRVLLPSNLTRRILIKGELRSHEIIFYDHFSFTMNPTSSKLLEPAPAPSGTVLPLDHFAFIVCRLLALETDRISQYVLSVSPQKKSGTFVPRQAPAAQVHTEFSSFRGGLFIPEILRSPPLFEWWFFGEDWFKKHAWYWGAFLFLTFMITGFRYDVVVVNWSSFRRHVLQVIREEVEPSTFLCKTKTNVRSLMVQKAKCLIHTIQNSDNTKAKQI